MNQDKLAEAVLRAGKLERGQLLAWFRQTFTDRNRLRAFVFAEALIEHGIPPIFWHDTDHGNLPLEQRFDLFLYDLRWLRRTYRCHADQVRYKRSKRLLSPFDDAHYQEAEFAFYNGQRQPW